MIILYISILLLIVVIFFLARALYLFGKKGIFLSKKEKDFIIFVIDMYIQYAEDLEINSKEQHDKIVEELNKIKNKHFKDEDGKNKNA